MSEWRALGQRVSGKWPVPLLAVGVALLGVALLRLRPDPSSLPLPEALSFLDELIAQEVYGQAASVARELLERRAEDTGSHGSIYLRLARAEAGQALQVNDRTLDTWSLLGQHYRFAEAGGATLNPEDMAWMARTQVLLGRPREAFGLYERSRRAGHTRPWELIRAQFELSRDRLGSEPAALDGMLEEFFAELPRHRLEDLLWGLERKIEVLDEMGRLNEANALLLGHGERFADTDLGERFAFLEGLLLYKTGHFDEAERHLRALLNRVDRLDPVAAQAGWLLGRVVLSDGGPQRPLEALSFFQNVTGMHPASPYALAARVGSAEAMAWLERHDDAISTFRYAIDELKDTDEHSLVSTESIRTVAAVLAEAQRRHGRLVAAIGYAELALSLVSADEAQQELVLLELLAQLRVQRGQKLEGAKAGPGDPSEAPLVATSREARSHFRHAAEHYQRISRLAVADERRSSAASWESGELWVRAGRLDEAAVQFESFARERSSSPLVPRALLRLAQLHQMQGRLAEAVEAYQACFRRYPRSLDGARALIPLAECYLALGEEQEELAERTLRIILEDSELFTPEAPEFAGALFLLGEVLNRRGKNEEAITMLDEALARYPGDPRTWQATYLLADSYRRSALALKEDAAASGVQGEREQLLGQSRERFERARLLYRRIIDDLPGNAPDALNPVQSVYRRHAQLYEADCLFETQAYREALALYEDAATLFKHHPSSLAAYVQIVNCHAFLGQTEEARAALARAMVLVDAMPQQAFDGHLSPEGREEWRRYFRSLEKSGLF